MTEQVSITINHLGEINGLFNNQITLWLNESSKIKDVFTQMFNEMSRNVILSNDFKKALYLQHFCVTLNPNTKLKDLDKRCLDVYWFQLYMQISYTPICVHINHSSVKFILLDNEICSSAIKFIKKYVDLCRNINLINGDVTVNLMLVENKNKTLQSVGFVKQFYENCNLIDHYDNLMVVDVDQKYKKKSICASKKTDVWNYYIGETFGKSRCMCCKIKEITSRNFDVGHIVAEVNGGSQDLCNLRPICRQCNLSMRSTDMRLFMIDNGYGNL